MTSSKHWICQQNYIALLIYSCLRLCQLDTCKVVMLPSSETFEIHGNVIWVFSPKEKNSTCEGVTIVPLDGR